MQEKGNSEQLTLLLMAKRSVRYFRLNLKWYPLHHEELSEESEHQTYMKTPILKHQKMGMSGLFVHDLMSFRKYVLGKVITMSNHVYLQTLELEIRERCPEVY